MCLSIIQIRGHRDETFKIIKRFEKVNVVIRAFFVTDIIKYNLTDLIIKQFKEKMRFFLQRFNFFQK